MVGGLGRWFQVIIRLRDLITIDAYNRYHTALPVAYRCTQFNYNTAIIYIRTKLNCMHGSVACLASQLQNKNYHTVVRSTAQNRYISITYTSYFPVPHASVKRINAASVESTPICIHACTCISDLRSTQVGGNE